MLTPPEIDTKFIILNKSLCILLYFYIHSKISSMFYVLDPTLIFNYFEDIEVLKNDILHFELS